MILDKAALEMVRLLYEFKQEHEKLLKCYLEEGNISYWLLHPDAGIRKCAEVMQRRRDKK